MTLDDLINALNSRLNKDQAGRVTSPRRINPFLSLVNIKLFNTKAGLPEEYVPGQPLPRQAIDLNAQISEDLDFCLVHAPHKLVGGDGIPRPKDFARMYYMSVVHQEKGKPPVHRPVSIIFGNERSKVFSSPWKKPTKRNPVAILEGGSFKVWPLGIHVDLAYYRVPKTPFFDYIIVNQIPQYLPPGGTHDGTVLPAGTPSRSVELEWPEPVHTTFLDMLTSEVASSIKDRFHHAVADNHTHTGK